MTYLFDSEFKKMAKLDIIKLTQKLTEFDLPVGGSLQDVRNAQSRIDEQTNALENQLKKLRLRRIILNELQLIKDCEGRREYGGIQHYWFRIANHIKELSLLN